MNMEQKHVRLGDMHVGNDLPLFLIAGPCQLESAQHAFDVAGRLLEIAKERSLSLIYKTSFDKANRTSAKAPRGIGLEAALPIFDDLRRKLQLKILTDVHESYQCPLLADHVDVLQIPAFLCRQTDLLCAAARTGLVVNVKKGQFLAPWDMKNVINKLEAESAGEGRVLVTERGTSFGYQTLVNDMRALPIMAHMGWPVIFDATHSVQQPGASNTSSGGDRRFVETLARAAVAIGVAGLFIETHEDPDRAPSDGPNMVKLEALPALLDRLLALDTLIKPWGPSAVL